MSPRPLPRPAPHVHELVDAQTAPGHFVCADPACHLEWDDLHTASHRHACAEPVLHVDHIGWTAIHGSMGHAARLRCQTCGRSYTAVLVPRPPAGVIR